MRHFKTVPPVALIATRAVVISAPADFRYVY
jgi:hypothetical protein